MKNYFDGCTTLDALKARYRIMAKELHPDLHPELGDEPMKELNAQFERLSERLSHVAADGRTEATAEQAEQAPTHTARLSCRSSTLQGSKSSFAGRGFGSAVKPAPIKTP